MAKGESKAKRIDGGMQVDLIPVASIVIGSQMLRRDPHDDDIQELAADIASHGLMQPIGVAPIDGGRFQLLWGSRRLAAHIRLNRSSVQARVCDPATSEEVIGTAVRENLMRRQLTLREEIDAVRRLTGEGRSPGQISDLVGKTRQWVDRRLAFDQLPVDLRSEVLDGDIPLGHAEALALVSDPGAYQYLRSWCLQNRPSLTALRASIEAISASPSFSEAVEAGAAAAQSSGASAQVFIACNCCHQPVMVQLLRVVRVCVSCESLIQQPPMEAAGEVRDADTQ